MPIGLIDEKRERELFEKLVAYYQKLYPGEIFDREEKILTTAEIGELYYTYPGEEQKATFDEYAREINNAITKYNYSTPIIILEKGDRRIVLDGHRRLKVAYSRGMPWKAFIIRVHAKKEFGIEKLIEGKVKDLFSPIGSKK